MRLLFQSFPNTLILLTDVFFIDLAAELPEHTKIDDYVIDLIEDYQLPYGSIYSLVLVELETLKIYIKIKLANRFIRLSKPPAETSIFFVEKLDRSLWLCLNYRRLNNLTMKN